MKPGTLDKLETLRTYRHSKGLCFTCRDKWSNQHNCPDQVPVHIIEELVEVLQAPLSATSSQDGDSTDEELMALDSSSPFAKRRRHTIWLQGMIGSQQVLILVDSGSACSFIHPSLVTSLKLPTVPIEPARCTIANGATIECTKFIPHLTCSV